jgi:mercuric ion binding protein
MKSIKLILIALIVFVQTGKAQQKTVNKIILKTPMAACDPCKDKIENYIMRQDGVISVNVDIKKHTTTIVYYTDRTTDENLKASIADVGFDADDVTAEDDAVKRLPKCCQKTITTIQDSTANKRYRSN